jgi:hypothetical protein
VQLGQAEDALRQRLKSIAWQQQQQQQGQYN